MMNTTTKPGVLAVMDDAHARTALYSKESFRLRQARSAVKRLAEAAQRALDATPGADQVNANVELSAALAAFRGEA